MNRTVRILQYPEDHINAYARIEYIFPDECMVSVSNMNQPFQGTLGHERLSFDEVDGDIIRIVKIMQNYVTEMEGYSYFGSNPGIPVDVLDEVAEEILQEIEKNS